MINYEITKAIPQQLFMQVRYYREGQPDYWKNFKVMDFSADSLHNIASNGARSASLFWASIESQPDEVSIDTAGTAKEVIYDSPPTYNLETEITESKVTETEDTITHGWIVRNKTVEEIASELEDWRKLALVTPRQARLELAKRGQLANIDAIIASLPADQQEVVQIEWEYAVSIERLSPWVIQLGSALGLDEVGLDELFKSASEL